jgi:Domain of unknown function (DUF4407)
MERLFIWLSGADDKILSMCTRLPRSERRKYAGFGMLVLIPAVCGLFSMGFVVSTFSRDPKIYVTAGALWFFIVLSIDRFLSATFYKSSMGGRWAYWTAFLFRLAFAGFIGLAVSHPLVLFLFDGSIKQKLADTRHMQIDNMLNHVQQLKENAQKGPDVDDLNKKIEDRACLSRVLEAEQSGVFGEISNGHGIVCGTSSGKRGCATNCKNLMQRISVLDKEIGMLQSRVQQRVVDIDKATANDVSDVQYVYDEKRSDYLARVNALTALERSEPQVRVIMIFLITFFLFLDTLVITLKAITPPGEYEEIRDSQLLAAQTREQAMRSVLRDPILSGFKAVAQARRGNDAKTEDILTLTSATVQLVKELNNQRAGFDAQMSAIWHDMKTASDNEQKTYLSRLANDMRDTFNASWRTAMSMFSEYLRIESPEQNRTSSSELKEGSQGSRASASNSVTEEEHRTAGLQTAPPSLNGAKVLSALPNMPT